jgi:hypothetical protein
MPYLTGFIAIEKRIKLERTCHLLVDSKGNKWIHIKLRDTKRILHAGNFVRKNTWH